MKGDGGDARSLEDLAGRACEGDRDALEEVVRALQDAVYGLALRMLWHPEDARDATQEILVRIVTRLRTFRGESSLTTWAYRVAANHLLDVRRSRLERQRLTFASFGADLETGLAAPPDVADAAAAADEALLLEEVKVGCTYGMLLCLDRPHRLAYILGEILETTSEEGAHVLEITPAAFRQRLSRARRAVVAFTRAHCGLVNPARPCRCRKRVALAVERGRVDARRLLFAGDRERAVRFPRVLAEIRRLDEARRAAALYRSHPEPSCPEELAAKLRVLLVERW
jgi:RNA polymerase sigma factor (sigma-70 family)